MEKREHLYSAGGNVNWYSHYGNQYRGFLKKLKIELPYDPAMEMAMAPHSSTLAWKIPCTEEPGGLPSMGSHRIGHD